MEKKELLKPKFKGENNIENSISLHYMVKHMYDIVRQARSMAARTSDPHLKNKHKAIEETFLLRIEEITRCLEKKDV